MTLVHCGYGCCHVCVFWFFLCQSIPGSSASQLVCCVCGGQVPDSWLEETIITTRSVQYVHAFSVYRIAENFRGRKLLRISWFCGYTRKFSPQNLGHGIRWRCKSEQSAKVFSTKILFPPIRKSFLPRKFPAIWYVIPYCNTLAESHPCIATCVLAHWNQKSELNITSWCTYWLIKVAYIVIADLRISIGSHLSQHAGVLELLWAIFSSAYFDRITAFEVL